MSGLAFFAVNCWILGVMIGDIGRKGDNQEGEESVDDMEGENLKGN